MNKFKLYRKTATQPMRPYVYGEDLTGISVNKEDTLEDGGMIAVNPKNQEDRWYVAKQFFIDNYEEVINNHASDCATHNEPAYPNGKCDCGAVN